MPHVPYCLGHFDIKTLFLLRSSYEKPTDVRAVVSLGAVARAFQGPPRSSYCHRYAPIIDGDIGPPRTPKCDSRQSWTHESVHSTSKTLVRAHERRVKRESSLVVGVANISRGSSIKISQNKLLQMPFLELHHVYISYMTSHVHFG